jgi:hypothetical protein
MASNLHQMGPIVFTASCVGAGCTGVTLNVMVNSSANMTMNPQMFNLTITSNNTTAITAMLFADGPQGKPQGSNSLTLNPSPAPPATKLQVVTSPTSQIAGQSFSITVTAQDANGDTATTFQGEATLTATMNAQSVTLPQATLTNGVASVATNLLTTTGTWTITAASSGLTSGTTTIVITPGPLATIQIEAPTPVNAGDSFRQLILPFWLHLRKPQAHLSMLRLRRSINLGTSSRITISP